MVSAQPYEKSVTHLPVGQNMPSCTQVQIKSAYCNTRSKQSNQPGGGGVG